MKQAWEPDSDMTQILRLPNRSMINMLRSPVGKCRQHAKNTWVFFEGREKKSLRNISNIRYLKAVAKRVNNTCDRFTGKLEPAEERINELRYFNRSLTNWNVTIKRYNTKLLRMPQEEKRGSWTYEILSNNGQEISKIDVTKLKIQGSQRNQAVIDKQN